MNRGVLLFLTFLSIAPFLAWGQHPDAVTNPSGRLVQFSVKVDKQLATKDGAYLNGYLVNLPHARIQELLGKTIRVRGRVSILKGKTTDRSGNLQQGRQKDIKYISKPRIMILSQ